MKKNFLKLLASCVAVSVIGLGMVACGSKGSNNDKDQSKGQSQGQKADKIVSDQAQPLSSQKAVAAPSGQVTPSSNPVEAK